jgi:hypothetical protein
VTAPGDEGGGPPPLVSRVEPFPAILLDDIKQWSNLWAALQNHHKGAQEPLGATIDPEEYLDTLGDPRRAYRADFDYLDSFVS